MARGRPSKKGIIAEAASELFTKQGYQATSIDQVVVAAGVSKPTVYSNFPTKLALWETVLEALIESSKAEMTTLLHNQKVTASDFTQGWIALWEAWTAKPERLAVYLIMLGEQHKMAHTSFELFVEFESVLGDILMQCLEEAQIALEYFFILKAISKEAVLMPALMKQPPMEKWQFTLQLSQSITGK